MSMTDLDELAQSQHVQPMADVRSLFGTWPDEDDDEFEASIDELRHPRATGGSRTDLPRHGRQPATKEGTETLRRRPTMTELEAVNATIPVVEWRLSHIMNDALRAPTHRLLRFWQNRRSELQAADEPQQDPTLDRLAALERLFDSHGHEALLPQDKGSSYIVGPIIPGENDAC